MSLNKSKAISGAAVILAGVAFAFIARAQKPARGLHVSARGTGSALAVAVSPSATPAPAKVAAPGDTARELIISRETYNYRGRGRRDPFVSLMNTEELRPLLAELKLVAVAFDATGRNSVAVLRDLGTKEQYRVKVGQEIGRMRVAAIHQKSVMFGIEEFGYSRQEILAMNDSIKARTQ